MNPLTPFRDHEFGLAQLVDAAALLCGHLVSPGDDRVRDAPDERTVRYYQSSGLLDRPLRYDGRSAVYSFRHLLQAVAVKALQAQGLSLAQVQRALAGATLSQLEGAVAEAIGVVPLPESAGQDPLPGAPSLPVATAAPLRAYRVAPGVTITVDPAVVANPDALAANLANFLNPPPRSTP